MHSIWIVICLSSVFGVFGHQLVTMTIWCWMNFWNDTFVVTCLKDEYQRESKLIILRLDFLFECSTELNGFCNVVYHIFDANDDWIGAWTKSMLIWISISFSKHFDFDIWWIGYFTLEPGKCVSISFLFLLTLYYYYYYYWCYELWAHVLNWYDVHSWAIAHWHTRHFSFAMETSKIRLKSQRWTVK